MIKNQIEELEQKKDEIINQIRKLVQLQKHSDVFVIAELLHDIMCRSNHVDACDWSYSSYTTDGWEKNYSRNKYYNLAKKLVEQSNLTEKQITELLWIIQNER